MMLHPATAHFAMVLPVVASVVGLIYLFTKSEGMSKISSLVTVIAALAVIGVWYTGSQAGPQIYDYLSTQGQHELVEHKNLGKYLAIAFAVITVLQFIGYLAKKFLLESLAVILLLGATATIFIQGKHGGELVYNYGMPFKAYMMQDTLNEAVKSAKEAESDDKKVEIYEDAIDEINTMSEEVDKIYGAAPQEKEDAEKEDSE